MVIKILECSRAYNIVYPFKILTQMKLRTTKFTLCLDFMINHVIPQFLEEKCPTLPSLFSMGAYVCAFVYVYACRYARNIVYANVRVFVCVSVISIGAHVIETSLSLFWNERNVRIRAIHCCKYFSLRPVMIRIYIYIFIYTMYKSIYILWTLERKVRKMVRYFFIILSVCVCVCDCMPPTQIKLIPDTLFLFC